MSKSSSLLAAKPWTPNCNRNFTKCTEKSKLFPDLQEAYSLVRFSIIQNNSWVTIINNTLRASYMPNTVLVYLIHFISLNCHNHSSRLWSPEKLNNGCEVTAFIFFHILWWIWKSQLLSYSLHWWSPDLTQSCVTTKPLTTIQRCSSTKYLTLHFKRITYGPGPQGSFKQIS